MTDERRQRTEHHRELVHAEAVWRVRCAGDDYEKALDQLLTSRKWNHNLPVTDIGRDVETLLRRRADTVKGLHNA